MDEETLYISDCDGLLQTEIVGRFLRLPDETGRIVSHFSNNQSDSSDIEDLIACCGYTYKSIIGKRVKITIEEIEG